MKIIIISIILSLLILSILTDTKINYFFGAFGAMTAVLILVFKYTILEFIASIQLAANDSSWRLGEHGEVRSRRRRHRD
ncbi:MAG: mechanosensitive ion channel [Flavobacteriales bacterium]|nr:mechanosensitive ion channel [Flavobacteriales bacterium]